MAVVHREVLLRRMLDADRARPSEAHDFKSLMSDYLPELPDYWLDEMYQDFNHEGVLDPRASGETFGGPFGRLSSAGRRQAEQLPEVPPPGAPVEEFDAVVKQAFDFGFRTAFAAEPDGGWTWAVFTDTGSPLQSGVADSWDDARLAVIENLHPPSGER